MVVVVVIVVVLVVVLYIFTSKRASCHNRVHFFDIATSKSATNPTSFDTFYFQMCFAPQVHAVGTLVSKLPSINRPSRKPYVRQVTFTNVFWSFGCPSWKLASKPITHYNRMCSSITVHAYWFFHVQHLMFSNLNLRPARCNGKGCRGQDAFDAWDGTGGFPEACEWNYQQLWVKNTPNLYHQMFWCYFTSRTTSHSIIACWYLRIRRWRPQFQGIRIRRMKCVLHFFGPYRS